MKKRFCYEIVGYFESEKNDYVDREYISDMILNNKIRAEIFNQIAVLGYDSGVVCFESKIKDDSKGSIQNYLLHARELDTPVHQLANELMNQIEEVEVENPTNRYDVEHVLNRVQALYNNVESVSQDENFILTDLHGILADAGRIKED